MNPTRRTLLIADRNPEMIAMLRAAAQRRGFRVIEGRNGVEAVRLAIQYCPIAVLVDLDLGGLGGIEVARALRSVPAAADITVILRVGRALGAETLRAAIDAGVADCIEKTCPIAALFERLEKHVASASGPSAAPFPWTSTAIDELKTMAVKVVRDEARGGLDATRWPNLAAFECAASA